MTKKKKMTKAEREAFDRRAMANADRLREYAGGKLDREYAARREQNAGSS